MFIGSILGWIIAGLIVGAFARLLVPGRQSMGIVLTIILGIVGAFLGGYLSTLMFGPRFVLNA
ncbi:MAG TPA: GlsB/YeaQ/YmgE family stress response membrane protein, partial [Gemmataceae bacterium]|nr:GlsB/YeaQ/YmgE family stress response membrane protein [Gemmataceae bacterium]